MPRSGMLLRRFGPMDALAWLAGAVDGFLTTVMTPVSVRQRQAKHRFSRQWHGWVRRMVATEPSELNLDLPAESALTPLRRQLVGKTRGQVISLMGPPPATSAQPHPDARAPYWHADTWYYPENAGRPAVAVTFEQNIARSIDPLTGPR